MMTKQEKEKLINLFDTLHLEYDGNADGVDVCDYADGFNAGLNRAKDIVESVFKESN